VHKKFVRRPFGRRLVALAAAYAIALSGLIANFGATQAAAATAADPGAIICHTLDPAPASPAGEGTNGKICGDSCCIGCLMLMATVPPPPANAVAAAQVSSRAAPLLVGAVLSGGTETKSHRSRAPPPTA
jgi:hypothetical protein